MIELNQYKINLIKFNSFQMTKNNINKKIMSNGNNKKEQNYYYLINQ